MLAEVAAKHVSAASSKSPLARSDHVFSKLSEPSLLGLPAIDCLTLESLNLVAEGLTKGYQLIGPEEEDTIPSWATWVL